MVKGTGPDDRITAKDVEMFIASGPPPPAVAMAAAAPAAGPAVAAPAMPAAAYEDIPLTNIRQVGDRTILCVFRFVYLRALTRLGDRKGIQLVKKLGLLVVALVVDFGSHAV